MVILQSEFAELTLLDESSFSKQGYTVHFRWLVALRSRQGDFRVGIQMLTRGVTK